MGVKVELPSSFLKLLNEARQMVDAIYAQYEHNTRPDPKKFGEFWWVVAEMNRRNCYKAPSYRDQYIGMVTERILEELESLLGIE